MEKKMTTLPQTTGTRFPRAGNRAPAIPGGIQTMSGGTAMNANQLSAADVWRIFRANAWLIALLTTLGAVVGFGVNTYLAKNFAQYTAVGRVMLNPQRISDPTNPGGSFANGDASSLSIEQLTQSALLRSDTLWRQELKDANSKLIATGWYKRFLKSGGFDSGAAVQSLQQNLDIIPIPGTKLINVAMSSESAADAQDIVQSVVDRHIRNQRDVQIGSRAEELTALNNFVQTIKERVESNRRAVSQGLVTLGSSGRDGSSTTLQGLQLQISQLLTRRIERADELDLARGQQTQLDQQYQQGLVPASINLQVENTPEIADLRNGLMTFELQRDADIRKSPNSMIAKETDSMINAIKGKLEESRERTRATYFTALLESGKQSVAALEASVDVSGKQIGDLSTKLGELSREQAEMLARSDGVRQDEESVRKLEDRIILLKSTIQGEQNRLSTVDWATPPTAPDTMSFPRLPITLTLATLMGLGLAVGIAFLRELLDTSIRSPRDLAKVGNLNMLGMIPHESDDPQAEGALLPLVISQSPHSIMAENFRQVRTRLQHAASLDTTRSLLITSPSAGDGKTTVACNIAAGLALNGRKILLVDANFRRPNLHSVFGVSNDAGFGNVLAGQASTESVAKKTSVPNLDVLPTGPRPANPTELLESQLLVEFIDRSLEEYDHVIFDSGPILLVSETVALAPRVDGVVTVVKAQANSRGVLLRMRDALRQVKAEHLGVVLNGVRNQGGGYYGRNIKNYYAYQNSN